MKSAESLRASIPRPRVLVLSMSFAPCKEVGGKRFSFLSRYLAEGCEEYHVLARCERETLPDPTAFRGNVHRVAAFPDYPPRRRLGFLYKLSNVWARFFCWVDPQVGWVLPATVAGIRLCRRHRLNLLIVTIPYYSPIIAATLISMFSQVKLIIDYRDPMTVLPRRWPGPFGHRVSVATERAAIRRADGIVFCSAIMKEDFVSAFGSIAPARLKVIHNGFPGFEPDAEFPLDAERITMVYAGEFYGARRLSVIAPTLAKMLRAGELSPQTFRLHLYTELRQDDHDLIDRLGLKTLIEVHERIPYQAIKKILRAADILFLPSGDDVAYAVPYKFFDYLSVRRPILAVAPTGSSVFRLMHTVDCGEFATFGDSDSIRDALRILIRGDRKYTFSGAEQFLWENAATAYMEVINTTVAGETSDH